MAQLELDPLFVKALRLLHSKAKDSAEQLRQLIEDTLAQRQSLGVSSGKDTKSLLSTIKLENEPKSPHALSRKQSPKHEVGAACAPRLFGADDTKKKDMPPLDRKPASATAPPMLAPTKSEPGSVNLEVTGLFEAKRPRTESPTQRSQSSSPASRVTSSSSPTSSSEAEDFAIEMGLVCVVCNQLDVTAKNQLIECHECHCLYHQECHRPPATDYDVNDPRFVWYCARCTKNMKKMATKPAKPASKPVFGVSRELTPPTKPETPPPLASQPFKRSELKVPALSSGGGPNKPIGLAGLAANLSKPKPLKPPLSSSSSSSSSASNATKSVPSSFSGLSSLAIAAAKAGTTTVPAAARPGNGSSGAGGLSTPSRNNSGSGAVSSSAPTAIAPGSRAIPGNGNGGGTGGNGSGSMVAAANAAGGNGKQVSSSMLMSADKRLQIMKKKAAAKMQEKRRVTPK